MKYQVIHGNSPADLTESVREWVEEKGWRPQGSVTMAQGHRGPMYAQALIKDDD